MEVKSRAAIEPKAMRRPGVPKPVAHEPAEIPEFTHPSIVAQRARTAPNSLTTQGFQQLGQLHGNQAVQRLLRQSQHGESRDESAERYVESRLPDSRRPVKAPQMRDAVPLNRTTQRRDEMTENDFAGRDASAEQWSSDGMLSQRELGQDITSLHVLRQPGKPEKTPVVPAQSQVEVVWKSLKAFSDRATPELSRVDTTVSGYITRYDGAHASFVSVLSEAKKEADERQKWADVMLGIIIGTGVGLATGGLYTATSLVGKIIYEAAGEVAETAIGGAIGGSSKPDFTPPANLNNDKVARGYLDKLRQAWRSIALMQAAVLKFSDRRDQIRDAPKGTSPDPKDERDLNRLKDALAIADQALLTFMATLDTPLLFRDQRTIEQDIWIAWMSESSANAVMASGGGDGPIGRKASELALTGRLMPNGRGYLQGELVGYAKEEKARVGQIGQIGVVIVPPTFSSQSAKVSQGILHVREDAAPAVGRATPTGLEQYVKIAWKPGEFLRPGEVAMVTGTTPLGLEVKRLNASLASTPAERDAAFQTLGIKPGEYHPEAAEMVRDSVSYAVREVNEELRLRSSAPAGEFRGGLRESSSEDGVLVSEADGTKRILFAPLTNGGIAGAEAMRARSGAPRIVAIDFDREHQSVDYRGPRVIVTRSTDTQSLAKEIRDAQPAAK